MEVLTKNKVKKLHDNECYIFDINNQITHTHKYPFDLLLENQI